MSTQRNWLRINFAISDSLKKWLNEQDGIEGVTEESSTGIVFSTVLSYEDTQKLAKHIYENKIVEALHESADP